MVRTGCVFVAGIHPSRTWMSGSFESVRWNACVHRLDLGFYPHPKEFLGNGVRNRVNSTGKIHTSGAQRRAGPATLHHTEQRAQHTTDWAIPTPDLIWQRWSYPSPLISPFIVDLIHYCWSHPSPSVSSVTVDHILPHKSLPSQWSSSFPVNLISKH